MMSSTDVCKMLPLPPLTSLDPCELFIFEKISVSFISLIQLNSDARPLLASRPKIIKFGITLSISFHSQFGLDGNDFLIPSSSANFLSSMYRDVADPYQTSS